MRWALTSVPVAAALAVAGWAFTAAPLQVTLVGFRTSHAAQELDSVQVRLHNSTDRPVVPHVMVVIGSRHPTGFWEPLTGGRRLVIDPRATATVTFRSVGYTWSPAEGTYWLVQAYTSSPDALSTTPPLLWKPGP